MRIDRRKIIADSFQGRKGLGIADHLQRHVLGRIQTGVGSIGLLFAETLGKRETAKVNTIHGFFFMIPPSVLIF